MQVVEAARPAAEVAAEAELAALRTRQLAADTQFHAEVGGWMSGWVGGLCFCCCCCCKVLQWGVAHAGAGPPDLQPPPPTTAVLAPATQAQVLERRAAALVMESEEMKQLELDCMSAAVEAEGRASVCACVHGRRREVVRR